MAGTGSSSPFIKDEPDQLYSSNNRRFIGGQQFFSTPQPFSQFTSTQSNGGSINLNSPTVDMLVQNGRYLGSSFQSTFNQQATNPNASFARGISILDNNDLLEGLDFQDHSNQNYNPKITQNIYSGQSGAADMSMDQHARLNNV